MGRWSIFTFTLGLETCFSEFVMSFELRGEGLEHGLTRRFVHGCESHVMKDEETVDTTRPVLLAGGPTCRRDS